MNMMNLMSSLLSKKNMDKQKDEIAALLRTSPDALDTFEKAYWKAQKSADATNENFFLKNSRLASAELADKSILEDNEKALVVAHAITEELLCKAGITESLEMVPVTNEIIKELPEELRPQLTGHLMKVDITEPSYIPVFGYYKNYLNAKNSKDKFGHYMHFLQGLDLLDLDPVTYETLSYNPNSMEHWFYALEEAVNNQNFFKVPKTKIVKVPLTLLQLTRLPYESLTPTTLKIVDDFCMKAFDLDVTKEYFIKTGTYSSKFDFRNAVVRGEKEVRELGEYLLYIHHQALQMASMLNNVSIPGVSTTNHWVVREHIPDKEDNPCIYKGMPLHTEYRFFVDFDTNEVLGVSPYWREDVMKKNFSEGERVNDPDKIHDYIIYSAHEPVLYQRYNDNVDKLTDEIKNLIPSIKLFGQWSIDVMQNGDDFWIIDMALANQSALNDVVPNDKLKQQEIDWIPNLSIRENLQSEGRLQLPLKK